jgi:hypothetical protein
MGGPRVSRRATASHPLFGVPDSWGAALPSRERNGWFLFSRPVPAKDDSAFAVAVIMISRRREGREPSGAQDGHCVIQDAPKARRP